MSYVTIGRKLYNDMSAAYEREQTCEILPETEATALREVAERARIVCSWVDAESLDALRESLRELDAVECKEGINDGQPTDG